MKLLLTSLSIGMGIVDLTPSHAEESPGPETDRGYLVPYPIITDFVNSEEIVER